MKSKVIKLADLDQFSVNPEYKETVVSAEKIQSLIESMASALGTTLLVDNIEENCGVLCKTEDGETVLIYPSLQISGGEQAASDVKGKRTGDSFSTSLNGKTVILKVEKILVNRPLAIDNGLAVASGIDGITTLEELKSHLMANECEKKAEENCRQLTMEYIQYMIDNSDVELNEDEVTGWTVPQAKKVYEEELSYGIDLRFTEDGEYLSEEETLKNLAEELRSQFKLNVIQERFAEENGYAPASSEDDNPYDRFMFETLSAKAKEALR